jgi:hypothetical protein
MENTTFQNENIPLSFTYKGRSYKGEARPVKDSCREGICHELEIELNGKILGTISCGVDMRWTLAQSTDQEFVNMIGEEILMWYK